MNWSKNLYTFMLGVVIVLSGCFGSGTSDGQDETGDADDGSGGGSTPPTTPSGNQGNVLWYVSGTAYHQCTPTTTAPNNTVDCIDDDETLDDVWVMIQNYTTIHQAPNTGIQVHSYSAGMSVDHRIGSVCTNGAISGWGLRADNGERYDNSTSPSNVDGLLPYAGLECDHYLFGTHYSNTNLTVRWHVAYEVLGLTQGPH